MENQRTALEISDDAAPWSVWDQPFACLTEAAAATADADYYYNATDYAAIVSGRGNAGIVYGSDGTVNQTDWHTTEWDSNFPVGLPVSPQTGWIQRRKLTGNTFGNGVVPRYRYNNQCFIPASWTGESAGALLINPLVLGGPFQGSVPIPLGFSASDVDLWHDETWPSGAAKMYLSYQNSSTKEKAVIRTAPIPESSAGYTGDTHCAKDSANKRVYYLNRSSGAFAYWYADFSAGISGMTISAQVNPTRVALMDFIPSDSANSGFTDGHPTGKRLWYFIQNNRSDSHLFVLDLDASTFRELTTIPGLTWVDTYPNLGFSYDAADNVMRMIEHTAAGEVWMHSFAIPSDPTSASNYSVSTVEITPASGVTVEPGLATGYSVRMFGERVRLVTIAGQKYIFIPQHGAKPLVFKPA